MFNPHTYDNSTTAGAAFMEIVQERDSGEPPQPVFMPLKRTHLTGTVTGPLARLTVEHLFGHPDGVEAPVLEAVYRFPLPGDAAVTGVRVRFGDVEIRAELAERGEAEHDYDEARRTGRKAVLLTRESPDVFSLHVSGIEPGQDVQIYTDYVQLARTEREGYSLRVPLTPAPRYTSFEGSFGRHAHGQPLALANDPGHRFSLNLGVGGAVSIHSPTHALDVNRDGDNMNVSLVDGEIVPDRDLLIEWQPDRSEDHTSLQVMLHRDEAKDGGQAFDYFLAMVNPPVEPGRGVPHAREIVLLVDRSGSMSGPKWEAADWALRRFLSSLKEYDSFSVGLFHNQTRWFASQCLAASEDNVDAARRFIAEHTDSGGTELETALDEALRCGRVPGERSRHVVIITDAQVSNAATILELARAEAREPERRRISVLCIDAAPNSHLVHELVAIGGGRASFLTSDPDQEDITTALDDLLTWWDEPAETGLSLTVNRPDAWVMGRQVDDEEADGADVSRIDLGDLPPSRSTWVVGRVPSSEEPVSFTLERVSGEQLPSVDRVNEGDPAIKSLFGAKRLMALEYQIESMQPWSYRRRSPEPVNENLRRLLVAESLYYGLACSETAFVAVREEAGKIVERGAIVPNALPYGWAASEALQPQADMAVAQEFRPDVLYSRAESASASRSSHRHRYSAPPIADPYVDDLETLTLFQGVPELTGDTTVLYEMDGFERSGTLLALRISTGEDGDLPFDGVLEVYAGDYDRPRARVRISDMITQHGVRPLNVRLRRGKPVRVVLRDVVGVPTELAIELDWRPR